VADGDPDAGYPDTDFTAFDGEEIIGRVYRISHGKEEGLWFGSMTVSRPGPALTGAAPNLAGVMPASASSKPMRGCSGAHAVGNRH
jgi:hypothetical protein